MFILESKVVMFQYVRVSIHYQALVVKAAPVATIAVSVASIRRWRVKGHQDHLPAIVAVLIPVRQRTMMMGVKLYVIIDGLRGQWWRSLLRLLHRPLTQAFITAVAVQNNLIETLRRDLLPEEFLKVTTYLCTVLENEYGPLTYKINTMQMRSLWESKTYP